jgi:uncharacterized protein
LNLREKLKLSAAFMLLVFIFSFLAFFPFKPGIIPAISAEPNYPNYSAYVNDYAGVLQSGIKTQTEDLITKVEKDTSCEIAVAIINSLEGISVEEYAVTLFEKWGVGKKKEDNGVLLLIAIEDRKLRIEVGYGLEGTITDLEAGNIINNVITPKFKQNDYNSGVYDGVAAIANQIYAENGMALVPYSDGSTPDINTNINTDTLESDFSQPEATALGGFFDFIDKIFSNPCIYCCFPIFLIIIIISVITNILRRRCPRCKKIRLKIKNTILKEATYTTSGLMLVERTCSNCGFHDEKNQTIPKKTKSSGGGFFVGGGGSSGGGGFGGFGGGSSGGGGASGGW